jgi:hypothetical protein
MVSPDITSRSAGLQRDQPCDYRIGTLSQPHTRREQGDRRLTSITWPGGQLSIKTVDT